MDGFRFRDILDDGLRLSMTVKVPADWLRMIYQAKSAT